MGIGLDLPGDGDSQALPKDGTVGIDVNKHAYLIIAAAKKSIFNSAFEGCGKAIALKILRNVLAQVQLNQAIVDEHSFHSRGMTLIGDVDGGLSGGVDVDAEVVGQFETIVIGYAHAGGF